MYLLKQRYPPPEGCAASGGRAREAVEQARVRLEEGSRGLVFEPSSHTYTLEGKRMASVSSVVHHYSPFDADKVAEGCSRNPNSKYFGQSPDQIKAAWAETAEHGTRVHAFAEACCDWCRGRGDLIEPALRGRVSAKGLSAESPKEEAAARWWDSLDLSRYTVVAKETKVVNRELGYAGTFDLLLYDSLLDCFCIKDYKTNDDLLGKAYGHLAAPLSNIPNNDVGRYTVQQTLYMIALENLGLRVGGIDLVWLREDGFLDVPVNLVYANQIWRAVKDLGLSGNC